MIIGHSDKVRMEDQACVEVMVDLHQKLFGSGLLRSMVANKGYASHAHKNILIN